jgi:F0F1-type ATP synthase assembly protein I
MRKDEKAKIAANVRVMRAPIALASVGVVSMVAAVVLNLSGADVGVVAIAGGVGALLTVVAGYCARQKA